MSKAKEAVQQRKTANCNSPLYHAYSSTNKEKV